MIRHALALVLLAAAPAASSAPAATSSPIPSPASSPVSSLIEAVYIEERIDVGPSSRALELKGSRKTWILPDRIRIETGKRIEIFDGKRGVWRMFDTEKRVFAEATRERLASAEAVPMTAIVGLSVDDAGEPQVAEPAFKKTGARLEIGSWNADAWRATASDPEGGEGTVWIAGDVGAQWADLHRVTISLFPGAGDTMKRYLKQVEALGGWPVRIERTNGSTLIRYTVTKIERVKVDPSLFEEMPKGLKKVRMF